MTTKTTKAPHAPSPPAITTRVERLEFKMAPHSPEAEEALLGSLLITPAAIPGVLSLIEPEDFFLISNQYVFQAIRLLYLRGDEVDYLTVVDELRRQGHLDDIGGPATITRLVNHTPSSLHADTYAALVQRTADRRRLLGLASEIAKASQDEEHDIAPLYSDLMAKFTAARPRALDRGLMYNHEVSDRFWTLQSAEEAQVTVFPLPWNGAEGRGLPFLTGGKLVVIGGDTGTGKSAACETIAEHWAKLGLNGFYIHSEMTSDDMVLRRYARWSRVPYLRLSTPWKLSDREREMRGVAETYIASWKGSLQYYRLGVPAPEHVLLAMRRAVQVFGAQFIVLDHFSDLLFDAASGPAQRYQFVNELVNFTEQQNIVLIIATQMKNTLGEGRRAFGTSALNNKAALFFDINRKKLKGPLKYRADGVIHTLPKGAYDPRQDMHMTKLRVGASATIPLFADMRRYLWRDRSEVDILEG